MLRLLIWLEEQEGQSGPETALHGKELQNHFREGWPEAFCFLKYEKIYGKK